MSTGRPPSGCRGALQPDGRFFYSGSEGAALTVRQCLALLRSGRPRVYMAGVALADYLPALAGDVELPDFLGSGRKRTRAHIWISGSGSTGPLHYDLGDNIHALVAGRKRFLLFDYQQQKALYPNPAFSSYPTYSRIDLDHPDFDRYPRLREAQGYEVVLEPGEMVFIPTGCWHRVSTPELSIAVNFWLSQHYFRYSTLRLLFPIALRLPIVLALAPLRALLDHQRLNPRRPSRNATRPGGLNP